MANKVTVYRLGMVIFVINLNKVESIALNQYGVIFIDEEESRYSLSLIRFNREDVEVIKQFIRKVSHENDIKQTTIADDYSSLVYLFHNKISSLIEDLIDGCVKERLCALFKLVDYVFRVTSLVGVLIFLQAGLVGSMMACAGDSVNCRSTSFTLVVLLFLVIGITAASALIPTKKIMSNNYSVKKLILIRLPSYLFFPVSLYIM